MKRLKNIFIVVLALSFSLLNGQDKKISKIADNYDHLAYVKTSEILLKVAERGHESVELFQKLGNSFYFNNKMEEASKWYGKLMAMDQLVDPEYYFRYAQALKGIENYKASDKWMVKFNKAKPSDLRGKTFVENDDYLSKIEKGSDKTIQIINLDINSELSDFGAIEHDNQLIFASSRDEGRLYKWNEQPYLDLYKAIKQDSGGVYKEVSKFDENLNTRYHESSVAFTPDNYFIYFTRNNFYNNKSRKDDKNFNRLKIFRAELSDTDGWENITSIHFNNDDYSVAHPSINKEGTKLYFASDMPGTTGMSDIYVVDIKKDGILGEPKNLGMAINTEGSESFPFINDKGDLYFASSGHPGLGGLDVFVVRDFENLTNKGGEGFSVENLGKPFNSSQDDFGYYENLQTKQGFFTSNREGGKGDDDIYSFKVLDCEQILTGVVKDAYTQKLLPGTKIMLFDGAGNELETKIVGNDALFSFKVDCGKEYLVRAEKEDYSTDEKRIKTSNKTKEELQLGLLLSKDKQEIKVGDDLAKKMDIPIIYFDFDKSNIRPDAATELQKIIAVLKQYPAMTLDVRSHTDSRAPFNYNEALSKRRNKSTIKYIIEVGGINPNRLIGDGYGESQLVNKCSDGVSCTEEEHQLNRRSEFIVIKM